MKFRIKRGPFWLSAATITAISWLIYYTVNPTWIAGYFILPCYLALSGLAWARCRDVGMKPWITIIAVVIAWIPVLGTVALIAIGIKRSVWHQDTPIMIDRRQPR